MAEEEGKGSPEKRDPLRKKVVRGVAGERAAEIATEPGLVELRKKASPELLRDLKALTKRHATLVRGIVGAAVSGAEVITDLMPMHETLRKFGEEYLEHLPIIVERFFLKLDVDIPPDYPTPPWYRAGSLLWQFFLPGTAEPPSLKSPTRLLEMVMRHQAKQPVGLPIGLVFLDAERRSAILRAIQLCPVELRKSGEQMVHAADLASLEIIGTMAEEMVAKPKKNRDFESLVRLYQPGQSPIEVLTLFFHGAFRGLFKVLDAHQRVSTRRRDADEVARDPAEARERDRQERERNRAHDRAVDALWQSGNRWTRFWRRITNPSDLT